MVHLETTLLVSITYMTRVGSKQGKLKSLRHAGLRSQPKVLLCCMMG